MAREYHAIVHVVVRGFSEDLTDDKLAAAVAHRLYDRQLLWPASGHVVAVDAADNAIELTGPERERLVWLLERPVAPGPEKDLDVAILRRLRRQP